jgi:predicted transcriptional regulator of viral defense system
MPVFTFDDAIKVLHSSRGYTKLFLHRCTQKKLISRVTKGIYYVTERANEYEIASHIVSPCYISMVSALSYYGMTTQIPNKVYVISTKRHGKIKDVLGYEIIFKRVQDYMMFGYHKEAYGNIFIADPQKAIVDIFYFNDINDLDENVFDKPQRLDVAKLVAYADRTGRKTVKSRVAELLRSHGYHVQAKLLLNGKGPKR